MLKNCLFILIFLATISNSLAQITISENCKHAQLDIMSLKFSQAESLIKAEKVINPSNVYPYYLENYIDILKIIISEDEEIFDLAEDNKAERIKIVESINDSSPYRNYLLANINLQWAIARLKFNEYFTAAIEINRAYRLIEENTLKFPEFHPNKITHGTIKIMIGLVPEKYNWLLNMISMEGNVEQGIDELYKVLLLSKNDTNYTYLREEALFYLGFIELNVSPSKENSLKLLPEIKPLADSSLLFAYLSINILVKTGQNFEVSLMFNKVKKRDEYYPFHYLDYLYADFYLMSLDTENARKYYTKFLKQFKGKNYIKDAWRKIAWTYLLENNNELYFISLSNVDTHGYKDIGKDKEAQKEFDSGELPNTDLLKARLLFDGFYFTEADSVLKNTNEQTFDFDQRLEKTYRQARIKHLTNNILEAKVLYKSMVLNAELTENYYPANSALKLGEIYEIQDSLDMAYYYYKKCTQMDFSQYENGIKSKAKVGIRRVEKDK